MTSDEKPAETLGDRIKEARLATAYRRRETVSQERMAALVTAAVGRRISQATWSTYELNTLEPPLDIIRVVAALSGLAPEYIAFGPQNEPPVKAPPTKPLAPADAPERAKAAKKRRRTG